MTPDEFKALLADHKPGDTITLTGEIPGLLRPKGALLEGITLDARKAKIGTLYPGGGVAGLTILGGTWAGVRLDGVTSLRVYKAAFEGPELADGYGLFVNGGADVAVAEASFTNYKTGAVLSKVDGFHIRASAFARMRSDGMTIGLSRMGEIYDNLFHGTRITGLEHPDMVQLFSRPTHPPTSDIHIARNRGIGMTQGICGFNHTRNGVNDGGFDRIVITDNDLVCGFPQGICLSEARDSEVTGNAVRTYPGARFRASINIVGGSVARSGNTVAAGAGKPAVIDPG